MASIKLKWVPIVGADIVSYNIYRSMVGFKTPTEAPFGLVNGDTLQLKINNTTLQTITFTSDMVITDLVTFLNGVLVGAKAYKSFYDNSLIVRSNMRESPGFIQVVGGTAMSKLGQTARIISEKSEQFLLGNVLFPVDNFEDKDGVIYDFYGISTIDSHDNHSSVSALVQPSGYAAPICVIEGKIVDLQGRRIADTKVTARVVKRPDIVNGHTAIIKEEISVLSGEDGRFSLPVLQTSHVILEIDDVQISDPIEIPEQDFVYFDDLPIYEDYRMKDVT